MKLEARKAPGPGAVSGAVVPALNAASHGFGSNEIFGGCRSGLVPNLPSRVYNLRDKVRGPQCTDHLQNTRFNFVLL